MRTTPLIRTCAAIIAASAAVLVAAAQDTTAPQSAGAVNAPEPSTGSTTARADLSRPGPKEAAARPLAVPDVRLVGHWHGECRFFGMDNKEGSAARGQAGYVQASLTISPDGVAMGWIGGAKLSPCVIESNRGWFGRMLRIKTDFIIRGKIAGRVSPSSADGVYTISAPLDLEGDRLVGSVFVLRGVADPYPFLKLQLVRE
jgi:hypothetical protein